LAGEALTLLGRVDILINNASEFFSTPIATVTEAEWDRLLDVNLKAPFLLSRALGMERVKQGGGKIINIADVSAFRPWVDFIPYSVSKAGLVTLTQGFAKALAPRVQVNAIAPGTILPPVTGWTSRQREQTLQSIPLKRFGAPDDVTRAVLFLIESDYITGTVIPGDGGKSIV
jgi:NAD(P)-dependent dehydrogenase (short-subunit alcohol dehydrogenase family)